jgi:hypothetical protein
MASDRSGVSATSSCRCCARSRSYPPVTGIIAALQVLGLVYVIFSSAVSGGPQQAGLTHVLHPACSRIPLMSTLDSPGSAWSPSARTHRSPGEVTAPGSRHPA